MEQKLTAKQKALIINLNNNIYGTFAEIGAGQETVRNFFRAGGASGTIAKAMSAYDKDFSDSIYGLEEDGRYVTQARLQKMLNYETRLIENRLSRDKHIDTLYFTYANTVATIDFSKKYKGHGWVGIRFQLDPMEDYNEIRLHVRFHETDARMQQETLGEMGVNLIYGAFYHNDNPKNLLMSLYDNIDKDKIEVDTINFSGPRFAFVDNRLMSLQLVKNNMTDAIIFSPNYENILPAALLYKKNIMAMRGSFRPVTKVNIDMFEKAFNEFMKEDGVTKDNTVILWEITLSNLKSDGKINERDFLNRADILCKMGHYVQISNYSEYFRLVDYFARLKAKKIRLALGVANLLDIFDEKYYDNLSGGILEAFGKLFTKDLKIFLYPLKEKKEYITSENLKVSENLKDLYKYFKLNDKIYDIEGVDDELLSIYSREILKKISNGESGWEECLPEGVAHMIKEKRMFGYYEPMITE